MNPHLLPRVSSSAPGPGSPGAPRGPCHQWQWIPETSRCDLLHNLFIYSSIFQPKWASINRFSKVLWVAKDSTDVEWAELTKDAKLRTRKLVRKIFVAQTNVIIFKKTHKFRSSYIPPSPGGCPGWRLSTTAWSPPPCTRWGAPPAGGWAWWAGCAGRRPEWQLNDSLYDSCDSLPPRTRPAPRSQTACTRPAPGWPGPIPENYASR